jgi:NADH-quinone oxidoreductase subunit A
MMTTYLPIFIVFLIASGFVAGSIIASHLLGPHRHSSVKDAPFECGITSQDNARVRFSVKYFLIAILFVLFDVEVVFFYPWAVNFKALGWTGLLEITAFIATVCAALLYLNQNNVFHFETSQDVSQ